MKQFCAIMLISAVIGEIEPFVTRVTKMDATVNFLKSQKTFKSQTYLSLGSVSLGFGTWRARCSKFPRAARVANCFRGARAPVDFLAVVFVLAIFLKRFYCAQFTGCFLI